MRYNKVRPKKQKAEVKKMLEMQKNQTTLEKANESEAKLIMPDMVKNLIAYCEKKYPTLMVGKISN